jgi:hypothetical protein
MFVQPAHAQSTPQEYRTSCTDARVEDRTVCRFADRWERTSLTDVNRCVGDIGNDNGALTCAVTGSQWRRTVGGYGRALGSAPKALVAAGIIGLPWVG